MGSHDRDHNSPASGTALDVVIKGIKMTEKTMIEKAQSLAAECHDGMVDKYGNPYMEHLERVADRVREMEYDFVDETSEIELYIATAYLHDIVEDTKITRDILVQAFPADVVTAIYRLTREKGMTYANYIENLMPRRDAGWVEENLMSRDWGFKPGKIARVVKLADLLDHVSGPTPCPPDLKKRYEKSLYRLISKGFA